MSIYLVALNDDSPDDWATLKRTWPGRHHILTDRIAFVAPTELSLCKDIGETLGMNKEKDVTGFVMAWEGPCFGWNKSVLWEWMKKVQ